MITKEWIWQIIVDTINLICVLIKPFIPFFIGLIAITVIYRILRYILNRIVTHFHYK